jgi:hypothetical protein
MKYKHIAQTALFLLSCCIANADTQKFEDVVGDIIEWKPGEIKKVTVSPAEEEDTDDLLSKDDLEKARTQLKESINKDKSLILIDRDELENIEAESALTGKSVNLGEADAIISLQGSTFENKVKIVVTVTKIKTNESQTIIVIKLPSELGIDLEKNLEASAALVAKAVNDSLGMYKMFQVIENNTNKEMANIAQQRANELSDSILKLISDISILDANTYKLVFQKQADNLNIDLLEANQTKYIDEKHRRQVRFIKELKILCDGTRDKGGLITPSNEQIILICRNIWQESKINL